MLENAMAIGADDKDADDAMEAEEPRGGCLELGEELEPPFGNCAGNCLDHRGRSKDADEEMEMEEPRCGCPRLREEGDFHWGKGPSD